MTPTFSVILPFFNEADFLPRTMRGWFAQTRPPDELILVDNGSTDGSAALCRAILGRQEARWNVLFLTEDRPGKTRALETACARAGSAWLVFSDADTDYPPRYLETLERLIVRSSPKPVALMALPVEGEAGRPREVLKRRAFVLLSKVFRKHVYTGGYGQCLRADAFRTSGGYRESAWPYVLGDHEIMSRILRHGRSLYRADLWCRPSPRRKDRRQVRWNLTEMALYHATPFFLHGPFFARFLGPRFDRRGLGVRNLRDQPWKGGAS